MNMKHLLLKTGPLCLLMAAAVACSDSQSKKSGGEEDSGAMKALIEEGQVAFRKCTSCHCATDPAIAEDEDWLKMNETTACISGGESTPRLRKALNAYLRSEDAIRPVLIDETYVPKEGLAHGSVTLPEVAGSAFLRADRDNASKRAPSKIRLYWKAGEKGRKLPMPVGVYRVISYAFYKRGMDDTKRWMMTATNVNGCLDVVIKEGKNVPLALQPIFYGELFTKPAMEGTMVRFGQTDLQGDVATLSLNGEPHLPAYVVLDAKGNTLHKAVFENT